MKPTELRKLERELHEFMWGMFQGLGRRERLEALSWYVTGLLLDGERKSAEPMAGRLVDDAAEISAMRQRLQECVSISAWSDDVVRSRLATKVDSELPGIEAFVIDDTGFPKKGKHSVGVQRQYSGTLGRQDNCQIATSLHLAGDQGSACIALRLYLPEQWSVDTDRRRKAKVPDDVAFLRKWEIALQQLDSALAWGVRRHVVLADAGYGEITEFRDELTRRGLQYLVAIPGEPVVWSPDSAPEIPAKKARKGPARTRYMDPSHPPPLGSRSLAHAVVPDGQLATGISRMAVVAICGGARSDRASPPQWRTTW